MFQLFEPFRQHCAWHVVGSTCVSALTATPCSRPRRRAAPDCPLAQFPPQPLPPKRGFVKICTMKIVGADGHVGKRGHWSVETTLLQTEGAFSRLAL